MKYVLVIILGFIGIGLSAQISSTKKTVVIKGVNKVSPMANSTSFAPLLKNLEAPKPGGNSYHDFLNQQKVKSAKQFSKSENKTESIILGDEENPVIIDEMNMRSYIAQIDLEGIYKGGTPLDNTMALGHKYLVASVNSFLWAYDIEGDSNLFVDEHGSTYNISFAEFGKDYITNPAVESPFDPKLIYLPNHDKFIFIFLSGRTPANSKIIVGFSSTNDPRDPWNVYMLPGNPRGVDQWTDFPMVGSDKDNMYLSINLLKANTSWQLGFEGSIVWQLPLDEGFRGDTNLTTTMYDSILYNGTNIRNLTPVQNQNPNTSINDEGTSFKFLSNRNFDIQNDSVFTFDIFNDHSITDVILQPKPYGVPPNGLQEDDNPSDDTDGLQTNDARFLGAISYTNAVGENHIEFVGNTKDFNTGRAGIYHGSWMQHNGTLTKTANIIGVDSLDFGYPNIAYTSNGEGCYEGSLIAFNHTSLTTFAGVSAIRHSNAKGYSNIIRLKEGDNYVRRLSGSYERWGDYFGIQTVPGNPSQVYTAGYYGTINRSSSTWFSKLDVTDTVKMISSIKETKSPFFTSTTLVELQVSDGIPPYTYLWSDGSTESSVLINSQQNGNYTAIVEDSKNCKAIFSGTIPTISTSINNLYPNPVSDEFNLTFYAENDTKCSFIIYDMVGKVIVDLGNQTVLQGNNVFSFSTQPLLQGNYVIIIKDEDDNNLVQKSFIKL